MTILLFMELETIVLNAPTMDRYVDITDGQELIREVIGHASYDKGYLTG